MEWVGTCTECVDRGLVALGVSSLEMTAADLVTYICVCYGWNYYHYQLATLLLFNFGIPLAHTCTFYLMHVNFELHGWICVLWTELL